MTPQINMDTHIEKIILNKTKAEAIEKTELVQSLWSGYGEIRRCFLKNAPFKSIVVKHIKLPGKQHHPRGWNTNISHLRKLKSYQVEMAYYSDWNGKLNNSCYTPNCIYSKNLNGEAIIILEDLNESGFSVRKSSVNISEMKLCLSWLAYFHASFIQEKPSGLWDIGTYWHLDTRPDELDALQDLGLKKTAKLIDKTLNECQYKTFVHGDAKLANFCFSDDGKRVGAVDFQYVGGGCGIKDVAYFIGSCLYENDCEKFETELLDYYFSVLKSALIEMNSSMNFEALELEWRFLFPVAWTDFHRFMKGWSPGHWKINSYSEKLARQVIHQLNSNE
ncbi:ecdysteroid 22-kinase family protein [Gaetbulibacter saemankumensis]|uniref:ecdysteroid 22-kinase family protein n=1 Tax=Gaetbulibacter saemankumensis TaxID=311208 RepID=UPI0004080C2C|nr:ecdysteroid 22-kinase family protein [Gaetbulibacter saemankumensis]